MGEELHEILQNSGNEEYIENKHSRGRGGKSISYFKRKICQFQKWSNYLTVRKWWQNIALFTALRYVRGAAV
jgi:hypothetical protein